MILETSGLAVVSLPAVEPPPLGRGVGPMPAEADSGMIGDPVILVIDVVVWILLRIALRRALMPALHDGRISWRWFGTIHGSTLPALLFLLAVTGALSLAAPWPILLLAAAALFLGSVIAALIFERIAPDLTQGGCG